MTGTEEFLKWITQKIERKTNQKINDTQLASFLYLDSDETILTWKREQTPLPRIYVHFLCLRFGLDFDDVNEKAESLINSWKEDGAKKESRIEKAEEFRNERIKKGYTQAEICKILSVTQQLVSAWERGKRSIPDEIFFKLKKLDSLCPQN